MNFDKEENAVQNSSVLLDLTKIWTQQSFNSIIKHYLQI